MLCYTFYAHIVRLTKYVTLISLAFYIEWKILNGNMYRAFYTIEKH